MHRDELHKLFGENESRQSNNISAFSLEDADSLDPVEPIGAGAVTLEPQTTTEEEGTTEEEATEEEATTQPEVDTQLPVEAPPPTAGEISTLIPDDNDAATQAAIRSLSELLGIPENIVELDVEQAKKFQHKQNITNLKDVHPSTEKFLQNPDNQLVTSAKDVDKLKEMEAEGRRISAYDSASSAVDTGQMLFWRSVQALGEALGYEHLAQSGAEGSEENLQEIAERETGVARVEFTDLGENPELVGQFLKEVATTQGILMLPSIVAGTAAAVGVGLAAAPGVIVGGTAFFLGALLPSWIMGTGESQQQIKEKSDGKTVAPWTAIGSGAVIGALDASIFKFGTLARRMFGRKGAEVFYSKLAGRMAAKVTAINGGKIALKGTGVEITKRGLQRAAITGVSAKMHEGFTETVQEVVSEVASNYATGKSIEDVQAFGKTLINTFATAAITGFAMGTTTSLATDVRRARQVSTRFDRMRAIAKETELTTADPVAAGEHRATVLQDAGIDNVYIDPQGLTAAARELGGAEGVQFLEDLGIVETLADSMDAGEVVEITGEAFANVILNADDKVYQAVREHVKLDRGHRTVTEMVTDVQAMQKEILTEVQEMDADASLKEALVERIKNTAENPGALDAAPSQFHDILAGLVDNVEKKRASVSEKQKAGRVKQLESEVKALERNVKDEGRLAGERDAQGVSTVANENRIAKMETQILEKLIEIDEVTESVAPETAAQIKTRSQTLETISVQENQAAVSAVRKAFGTAVMSARTDIRSAQSQLMTLAKDMGVVAEDIIRDIRDLRGTVDLARKLQKLQEKFIKIAEARNKKTSLKAIKDVLKRHKAKGTKNSKVGPVIQNILDRLSTLAKMKPAEAKAELDSRLEDSLPGDNMEQVNSLQVEMELQFLDLLVNPELSDANISEDFLLDLNSLVEIGKADTNESILARAVEAQELAEEAVKLVPKKGNRSIDRDKHSAIYRAARNAIDIVFRAWNGIYKSKLEGMFGAGGENTGRVNAVLAAMDLNKQAREYEAGRLNQFNSIVATLKERLGFDTDKQILDKVREDNQGQPFVYSWVLDTGEKITVRYTRAEARYLYAMGLREDIRKTSQDPQSNNFDENIYFEVEKFLDNQDRVIVDTLMEFYDGYYEGVNEVYKVMNNKNLTREVTYFPTLRNMGQSSQPDEFLKGHINRGNQVSGRAVKDRKANTKPYTILGDLVFFDAHIHEMEYYKAYAEKMRFITSVFNHEGGLLWRTLEKIHGKTRTETLRKDVEYFSRKGVLESLTGITAFQSTARLFRASALALSPIVAVKQLLSSVMLAEGVPTHLWLQGVGDFMLHGPTRWEQLVNKSDLFESRGRGGMDIEMQKFLHQGTFGKGRFAAFKDFGTLLIRGGDKLAVGIGLHAHLFAKEKMGIPLEQALNDAHIIASATQQSSDVDQLTELQRGPISKIFTMFMTSPNALARSEAVMWGKFRKGRIDNKEFAKMFIIQHVIIAQILQLMVNVGHWDNSDQAEAFLMGSFNGVFIAGQALERVGTLLVGMFNDDGEPVDLWKPNVFHPLQGLLNLLDGLVKIQNSDITLEGVTVQFEELNSIVRGAGEVSGLPLKKALDVARGLDPGEDNTLMRKIQLLFGYTPYVLNKAEDRE